MIAVRGYTMNCICIYSANKMFCIHTPYGLGLNWEWVVLKMEVGGVTRSCYIKPEIDIGWAQVAIFIGSLSTGQLQNCFKLMFNNNSIDTGQTWMMSSQLPNDNFSSSQVWIITHFNQIFLQRICIGHLFLSMILNYILKIVLSKAI